MSFSNSTSYGVTEKDEFINLSNLTLQDQRIRDLE